MSETGSSRTHVFVRTDASSPASGSSQRASTGSAPNIEDQPTVISSRPPLGSLLPLGAINPLEMGRVLEGQRLGHYELQEFVGGGGMGAVFRALDTMLNRIVAVKVLSQDHASDGETVRRFKNEAQSAARLDHDNIGRVYYVGEDCALHYIVFEFIEGVNLRELVTARGPLPLGEAISYTLQIADALAHASARDVVHRDIKPSNVLITPQGKAKLVDMGLARLHQVSDAENDLTASGVTLGTFDYISPEQARDPRSADVRSDLYSLGCTLYFILTGRPPFPEGTVLQKLLQHQGDEPADPILYRPDLPPDATHILKRLMAKLPEKRYQQPAELVSDLLLLANQLGLRPTSVSGSTWAAPSAPRQSFWVKNLPWMVAVAVLLVIVVVLNIMDSVNSSTAGDSGASIDNRHVVLAPPEDAGATQTPTHDGAPQVGVKSSNDMQPASDVNDHVPKTGPSDVTPRPADPAHVAAALPSIPNPWKQQLARWAPGGLRLAPMSATLTAGWQNPLGLVAGSSETAALKFQKLPDAGSALEGGGSTSVAPAVERKKIVICGSGTMAARSFTTLGEACNAAESGDVIELCFNGRIEERPIEVSNRKLTIRGGKGFSPVVLFRPDQIDPVRYSRSLIKLAGGQLTLSNLNFVVEISREMSTERWTLVESQMADVIRLDGCTLTIRNGAVGSSPNRETAFFDINGGPGAETAMSDEALPPRKSTDLALKSCIVRGEAALVRSADMQPWKLTWDNGLLAISEHLLIASGGAAPVHADVAMRLELSHVVASCRPGLLLLTGSEDLPSLLPLEVSCSDCIFVASAGGALIEQIGSEPADELRKRVKWDGARNFYYGFMNFWRTQSPALTGDTTSMSFEKWREFWGPERESMPSLDKVVWRQLPGSERAAHSQTPADFALADNAAVGSSTTADSTAADTTAGAAADAGFQADRLPALPSERPAPVRPASGATAP